MGFHKYSATRNMRITHARLVRKENGEIFGVFPLNFTKNASRFEYCFIGENVGVLTFNGKKIIRHPKFKNVDVFEGWCRRYYSEHDIETK